MKESSIKVPTGIPAAAFAVSGSDDNINEVIATGFEKRLADSAFVDLGKSLCTFFGKFDFLRGCGFNCFNDDV